MFIHRIQRCKIVHPRYHFCIFLNISAICQAPVLWMWAVSRGHHGRSVWRLPISYLSKDLLPFVSNWMPDSVAQKLHFHAPLFWPNSQLWPSFEAKSLWPKCRCLTYGMIIKFVHGKHMSIARGYPHFKLVKSCPWPYSLFLWGTPAFHRRIPFMTTSIHSPFLFIRAKTMTRKLRSQAAACPSCSNAYLRGSQLTGGNSLTPQIRRFPVKNGRVHQQKMRVLSIKWY